MAFLLAAHLLFSGPLPTAVEPEYMINLTHLREQIVRPALKDLGLWSAVAEDLVMATGYQESRYRHLVQLTRRDGRRGPALGMWQMEPRTHDDIWQHYLSSNRREEIRNELALIGSGSESAQLSYNLKYAAAMCRVHYYRRPEALPEHTPEGLAEYWKKYYNTPAGSGTVQEFIDNYRKMMAQESKDPA